MYTKAMAKILFFGYGANRSRDRMLRILGKEPINGRGAILEGYALAIEPLDLVPDGPHKILEQVWGKNFRSYTLKKGEGIVSGRVWELNDEDLKLAEWEFIGIWRELIHITVKLSNNKNVEAITEKIINTDPITEVVDGLNYIDNLNTEKKEGENDPEDDEYKILEIKKIRAELEKIANKSLTSI